MICTAHTQLSRILILLTKTGTVNIRDFSDIRDSRDIPDTTLDLR